MPDKSVDRTPHAMRVAVLHIELPEKHNETSFSFRSVEAKLNEAANLAAALNLEVVSTKVVNITKVTPKYLIGSGKAKELADYYQQNDVEMVVFNTFLSPTQQRNLEVALKCKVIDRTHLILEIFADRARTKAGRLQVELANLMYQQSRLVRTWTHLERQRGGLGKTGGPGERQIELDRRMIRDRITQVKKDLEHVEKERALHRRARGKAGLPIVSLVGYTNAGKSTLFNTLVGYGLNKDQRAAMVKDMLFATLDPLMRKMRLPSGRDIILSDTVGFVSDLPHELVKAFASTLEEVSHADLLLHVHDAASEDAAAQHVDVMNVLKSIDADDLPCIDIANKVDLLEEGQEIDIDGLCVSAVKKQGVEDLLTHIDDMLSADEAIVEISVPASDGKRLAWLHAHGVIVDEHLDGEMFMLKVRLSEADLCAFKLL